MNRRSHKTTAGGMLVLLLMFILNACATTKPEEIVPTAQFHAAIEATNLPTRALLPQPISDSTEIPPDDAMVQPSQPTNQDIPPQTINGVTVTINRAYADESHVESGCAMEILRPGPQHRQDPHVWGDPLTSGTNKHRFNHQPRAKQVSRLALGRERLTAKSVFRQFRWVV